jgi:hypothetical protein
VTPAAFAALPIVGLTAISPSNYSAIVFASADVGTLGSLTKSDIDAINTRTKAIHDFFDAGGGLLYLSGVNEIATYYNSVPVPPTAVAVSKPFIITSIGLASPFKLIEGPDIGGDGPSDDNCCATHILVHPVRPAH